MTPVKAIRGRSGALGMLKKLLFTFTFDDLPVVGNLRLDVECHGRRLLCDDGRRGNGQRRRRRYHRLLGECRRRPGSRELNFAYLVVVGFSR